MTHDELQVLKLEHWLRKLYIKEQKIKYKKFNVAYKSLKKRIQAIEKELG